ncbi:MAG: hypothetical protein ACI9SK_000967 [Zhongshania sp.]|jgi:hypothetical protein
MTARSKLWLAAIALYAAFIFWYTDFRGPLSEQEVDKFVTTMLANGGNPETIAFIEKFARQDTGRQFLMVNNIDYNDNPPQVDGAAPGETADKLMARYMKYMIPALLARASHPVLMGEVVYPAIDVIGIQDAENWTQSVLFRYPSRRTLMEIVSNPAFKGKHNFKTAALEKTIAYPIETTLYLSDLRLLLALVLIALTAAIDNLWLYRHYKRS